MVVTRFAPSPTGFVHVGSLRTALYSFLFARQQKGKVLLRIEDTDQKRAVEGAEENLIKVMQWAGITFDEGPHVGGPHEPYRQSERTDMYQKYADQLVETGFAYHCFCSEERLETLRQKQEASKLPTGYDGHCRSLTPQEVQAQKDAGTTSVIRLKIPKDEMIVFDDLVRGKVKFASSTVDDQVLLKSDRFPTYHLANVVDDHHMEVTHVIRGEEWLSSTPKHIILYRAFGWDPPAFAHLPLLLNADRSKLSKRQGDVSVEDYITKGYEQEELLNFIAFLGWNPGGTKEIYSLSELIEVFDLAKVQKAGAIFNLEKLNWFREVWKQRKFKQRADQLGIPMDVKETKQGGFQIAVWDEQHRLQFARELLLPMVQRQLVSDEERDEQFLMRCLYTVKDKIIAEPEKVQEFIHFYFQAPEMKTELFFNEKMGVDVEMTKKALEISRSVLKDLQHWDEQAIKEALSSAIQESGLKNGQVLWPLRVALTHVEFSPGAFESAWVLGKEKSLALVESALNVLDRLVAAGA